MGVYWWELKSHSSRWAFYHKYLIPAYFPNWHHRHACIFMLIKTEWILFNVATNILLYKSLKISHFHQLLSWGEERERDSKREYIHLDTGIGRQISRNKPYYWSPATDVNSQSQPRNSKCACMQRGTAFVIRVNGRGKKEVGLSTWQ